AFFDQQTLDQTAFRTGLMRNQRHAENVVCVLAHFVERLGNLDAASLAASTCVDLRLDDPDLAAEFFGSLYSLIYRKTGKAFGCRDTVLTQYFFSLILVDI